MVCGPEAPLVDGLTDSLNAAAIPCFGPSASAARLEGSKTFMKDLCAKYAIPTAAYAAFTDPLKAKAYITQQGRLHSSTSHLNVSRFWSSKPTETY